MKKIRVGVLFGGRSGEHEVSLLSAASVLNAIDKKKYEVVPIGITKEGRWVTAAHAERLLKGEKRGGCRGAAFARGRSAGDFGGGGAGEGRRRGGSADAGTRSLVAGAV